MLCQSIGHPVTPTPVDLLYASHFSCFMCSKLFTSPVSLLGNLGNAQHRAQCLHQELGTTTTEHLI